MVQKNRDGTVPSVASKSTKVAHHDTFFGFDRYGHVVTSVRAGKRGGEEVDYALDGI